MYVLIPQVLGSRQAVAARDPARKKGMTLSSTRPEEEKVGDEMMKWFRGQGIHLRPWQNFRVLKGTKPCWLTIGLPQGYPFSLRNNNFCLELIKLSGRHKSVFVSQVILVSCLHLQPSPAQPWDQTGSPGTLYAKSKPPDGPEWVWHLRPIMLMFLYLPLAHQEGHYFLLY